MSPFADFQTIIRRFEEAWARGDAPPLGDCLPADPALRDDVLPTLASIDLQRRLARGEPARTEDYLRDYPSLLRDEAILELAEAEFEHLWRQRRGRLGEFVGRFPEQAVELRRRLATPRPVPPLTGMFGVYRIERFLGEGAMGAVYRAWHSEHKHTIALKTPLHWVPEAPLDGRFEQEALLARYMLRHPNLCAVYDFGLIEGIPYLTMTYVEGRPLTTVFPPPRPPAEACRLVQTVAGALAEAHRQQVIHRDLKPSNILVDRNGAPVVVDFGLALLADASARRTSAGAVLGNAAYMSPEQARGASVDARADVYALGGILYELLTGRLPFPGETIEEVLEQLRSPDPPPPPHALRPEIDPDLSRLCLRCLAKNLPERCPSMAEAARELGRWASPRPGEPPAPRLAGDPRGESPTLAIEHDPRVDEAVLRLLRERGWDECLARLLELRRDDPAALSGAGGRLVVGWEAAERGHYAPALEHLTAAEAEPALRGWAVLGRALIALRERRQEVARRLLREARDQSGEPDRMLGAAVDHLLGVQAYQRGDDREARRLLTAALEAFGPAHYQTGRVLDSLALVESGRERFHTAVRLFRAALERKEAHQDEIGAALTHGQLGRLYLAWDDLDHAEKHFRRDLELAQQWGDARGAAQMVNHLGRAALLRERWDTAEDLLTECIRRAEEGQWPVLEAFARKDRAQLLLDRGNLEEAEAECRRSAEVFEGEGFEEGLAHLDRVRAELRRRRGDRREAVELLRRSAARFERLAEPAEAARTLWRLAQAQRGLEADCLASETYARALEAARRARRARLADDVEREWAEFAPRAYLERQGRPGAGPSDEPNGGEVVEATVVLAELRPEADPAEGAEDLLLREELYADLGEALLAEQVEVFDYRGDGFLAAAHGRDHDRRAVRAVRACREMLAEFNRPRAVLKWPRWLARFALETGPVRWARLGTPRRAVWAMLGTPVRVASERLSQAGPDDVVLGPHLRAAGGVDSTLS